MMTNGVRRDCFGHQFKQAAIPLKKEMQSVHIENVQYRCRKCGVRIHPDKNLHVGKRFTDKH